MWSTFSKRSQRAGQVDVAEYGTFVKSGWGEVRLINDFNRSGYEIHDQ